MVQLSRGVYSSENANVFIWTLLLFILFNSQRVLLVLQDLFRNRKLKLLKFAAPLTIFLLVFKKMKKLYPRAHDFEPFKILKGYL